MIVYFFSPLFPPCVSRFLARVWIILFWFYFTLFYFILLLGMFLFRALALLPGWVVSSISPSFCLFHFLFYFYLCFYLFSYFVFVFVFCFCFCFCLFRISLFQWFSVADVCMLCLSYPVLGHDIALSNAFRCIISVSWLVTTELIFLGWRISTDTGCAGCRRVEERFNVKNTHTLDRAEWWNLQ